MSEMTSKTPGKKLCPTCKGDGYDPPGGVTECETCGGTGEVDAHPKTESQVGPPPDGGDGGGTGQ